MPDMKITLSADIVAEILGVWAWEQPGLRELFPDPDGEPRWLNEATHTGEGAYEITFEKKVAEETPT